MGKENRAQGRRAACQKSITTPASCHRPQGREGALEQAARHRNQVTGGASFTGVSGEDAQTPEGCTDPRWEVLPDWLGKPHVLPEGPVFWIRSNAWTRWQPAGKLAAPRQVKARSHISRRL